MTPLQKLTKNVRDLGKLIVAKGFKNLLKSNKLPNLVTLVSSLSNLDTTKYVGRSEATESIWVKQEIVWLVMLPHGKSVTCNLIIKLYGEIIVNYDLN